LSAILQLTNNPKRHLRGPRFSDQPGTGKRIEADNVSERKAVCGCANGLIDLVSKGGRYGSVARSTRELLNDVAFQKRTDINSFATISDNEGLRAFRSVATKALKDLRAAG
jgi:hypothetical protein